MHGGCAAAVAIGQPFQRQHFQRDQFRALRRQTVERGIMVALARTGAAIGHDDETVVLVVEQIERRLQHCRMGVAAGQDQIAARLGLGGGRLGWRQRQHLIERLVVCQQLSL